MVSIALFNLVRATVVRFEIRQNWRNTTVFSKLSQNQTQLLLFNLVRATVARFEIRRS